MFGKISDFFRPLFTKGDTMPAGSAYPVRRTGEDERQRREKHPKAGPAPQAQDDDFSPDVTILSLPAIRAGLMEGAGSITDEDLARALDLINALARNGIHSVPVAEGQGLIDALAKVHGGLGGTHQDHDA